MKKVNSYALTPTLSTLKGSGSFSSTNKDIKGGTKVATSNGFTMVELIFIMIVMGVLATTMVMSMPDNRLLMDRNFITQKIKQKQIYALSYDNFNYQDNNFTDDTTCIDINKDTINTDEKNNSRSKPYQISSQTTVSTNIQKVCFDSLGRPYAELNNLLKMPIELNITYKGKTKTINIMPYSGCIVKK